MAYSVAVSREIAATSENVWALVSDLPRMGEFSPENVGGVWGNGTMGPALGATFVGRNRNGFRRWSTKSTIVECLPGQAFEIAITTGPFAVAHWRYEFEDTPVGCRVTESWADRRQTWLRLITRPLGAHDAAHAESEMLATLANLAAALQSGPGSVG